MRRTFHKIREINKFGNSMGQQCGNLLFYYKETHPPSPLKKNQIKICPPKLDLLLPPFKPFECKRKDLKMKKNGRP